MYKHVVIALLDVFAIRFNYPFALDAISFSNIIYSKQRSKLQLALVLILILIENLSTN
jgi:hypothetical protein